MLLLPAIDLKDGCAVRLKKGKFSEKTVYSDSPWEVAKNFENNGAAYIHLVDLDGALKGHSVNLKAIKKIRETVDVPLELGGGIRDFEAIDTALELGIDRVILGTIAVNNPDFVKEAISRFGSERIVVGVDARDGYLAINGWEDLSGETAVEFVLKMKEAGVKTVIYTDISRDGMLSGPNIEATENLKAKTGLFIIASGGVSGVSDLRQLSKAGVDGAIIGKAYYEGKINLAEAVEEFKNS